ncbi:rod shape-determining protein MreC [Novosphingobium sp. TH158]|uniref:rod shape-determining protein MreC n=1 Tax=Novosphingobium sp. TH158 TaxID=2067455 RepID=UPI000C7AB0BE|nr:rod shape-determining protein MreC [Novosphingobium sp. TH158]PLK25941.1 rod shape-determining protein MreC [Novosphingobium sp. TH158]
MAPPSIRRTGFSKRAQYGTFFGYMAAVVGALIGVAALLVSIYEPKAFSGLRGAASDATAPVGQAVAAGRETGNGFLDIIGGYFTRGSRVARLEKEAELNRIRLAEAAATAEENRRLKALLDLPKETTGEVAKAQLIASTGSSPRRFATISAGSSRGVATGMPVRSPLGLVGRVLEASRNTARVLLITDSESVVPVRRSRDGITATARGVGDGTLRLELVNLGLNPLKPGDVFVTSGSGGLFRPGIAVAVVSKLTHDGAIAQVLSDPSASEFVVVEPAWAASLGLPDAAATATPPSEPAKR